MTPVPGTSGWQWLVVKKLTAGIECRNGCYRILLDCGNDSGAWHQWLFWKGSVEKMMYPYLTLDDETEITHSEMKEDGSVKVYIETPDENGGFHSAVCWLPQYKWEQIQGYTESEMVFFKELVRNNAHLMIEFSQDGGVLNAAGA